MRAFAAAVLGALGGLSVAQAGLDRALYAIDSDCRERAEAQVLASWPAIGGGAQARGLVVGADQRAAYEQALRRRCIVSERIALVEGLRDELGEAEWAAFGGDALLRDLRDELALLTD